MNNFAFDKKNYVLLAIGMLVVIVGLILMSGSGSSEGVFNPDIFSVRRTKVAPVVDRKRTRLTSRRTVVS